MIFASLATMLLSCSEPTVTAEYKIEDQIYRETLYGGRQITFRGLVRDIYVVFDDNKQCLNSACSFGIFRPFIGTKINKGDICSYCYKSWNLYDKNICLNLCISIQLPSFYEK